MLFFRGLFILNAQILNLGQRIKPSRAQSGRAQPGAIGEEWRLHVIVHVALGAEAFSCSEKSKFKNYQSQIDYKRQKIEMLIFFF